MCVKEWKRIAEREARRYREHRAFMRGVEDAAGGVTERYRQSARWVLTVEYVLGYLYETNTEKERCFRKLFDIDGVQRYRGARGMQALAYEMNVSASLLYQWKNELLSLLLLAAAQTKALQPYSISEES